MASMPVLTRVRSRAMRLEHGSKRRSKRDPSGLARHLGRACLSIERERRGYGIGAPRPMLACTKSVIGRSLGWQVAVCAGLPSRNQWQWSADSLRTIAGAATVLLCSLLGP
jgi:hypothetical protein